MVQIQQAKQTENRLETVTSESDISESESSYTTQQTMHTHLQTNTNQQTAMEIQSTSQELLHTQPSLNPMQQQIVTSHQPQPTRANQLESQAPYTSRNASKQNFNNNNSLKMKTVTNQQYNLTVFLNFNNNYLTRIQAADIWQQVNPESNDLIIKTISNQFMLKTNADEAATLLVLNKLVDNAILIKYTVAKPKTNTQPNINSTQQSFSVVLAKLEQEISDDEMSTHLQSSGFSFRFCKRIISRATGKPTSMMRLITNCPTSFEKVLNSGVFYKNMHYPAFPSKAGFRYLVRNVTNLRIKLIIALFLSNATNVMGTIPQINAPLLCQSNVLLVLR